MFNETYFKPNAIMATMNSLESNKVNPEELMSNAARGFSMAHEYVLPDADHLRRGAADMFQEGAGELLYEKLSAILTDEQIDRLASDGLLEEVVQRLARDELAEIERRIQGIVVTDPHARNALEDAVYHTDTEQGRTRND